MQSTLENQIRGDFVRMSRQVTTYAVIVACGLATLLWMLNVRVQGGNSVVIGILLMIGAALVYQIPYFCYRRLCSKYKGNSEAQQFLGTSWTTFKHKVTK